MKLLPIVATGPRGGASGCGPAGCGSGCGSSARPTPAVAGSAVDPRLDGPPGPEDRLIAPGGRWSAEVFDLPLGAEHHILYAPLRRAAFVTTTEGRDELARLAGAGTGDPEGVLDEDLEEFLRGMEILDAGPESPPDDLPTRLPPPTAVTLFLTTACNLRCDYCYASAGDTAGSWMPRETARRGVDTVVDNAITTGADRVSIAFHGGGEPTLNWSVLTDAFGHMKRRAEGAGLAMRSTLTTNGVMSPARASWIAANLDAASVSFDGLPEVQDAHRPRRGGGGSSEALMRTLRRFDAVGFRYSLRVTVTADQIARLPDSVEFLLATFRPGRIQVEPAYRLGRWSGSRSAETEEFVAAYREARRRARAAGADLSYSAARLGLVTHHFCGASQGTFALSPDGNVSACYEVFSETQEHASTFFYGRPDAGGGYEIDHDRLDGLRRRATEHHEFCAGCFAKWSCAGDCHHKALTESPDGGFRGTQRCHVTRELTKDQILTAITEDGGVRWYEGSDASRAHPETR